MGLGPLRDDDPVVIGGYPVRGRLGAGGMGVVYLAQAPEGPVAVKRLRREYADDRAFRERFRREAAALTLVDGAFTARVLAVEVDAPDPYLVLEYVNGPSLAARVEDAGPLPPDQVRALGAGLAAALMAIHRAGIVHRDLKPANVLLSEHGPKVIDFGVAQIADATSLTETGIRIGSPLFMAPDQLTGQSGPPADVFSWALTVAYAATGRPAFGTGMTQAVMFRIMHTEPDLDGVSDDIRPVLAAALAKDPGQRPTPGQLVAALVSGDEKTVGERPDDVVNTLLTNAWPPPPTPTDRLTTSVPPSHLPFPDARRSSRKHTLIASGIAAATVAAGVVAALVVNNPDRVSSTPLPASTTATSPQIHSQQPPSTAAPGAPCTADDIKIVGARGHKPTITIPDTCSAPTQLVVKDVSPGTGPAAKPGDDVTTHYTLETWSDKQTPDSSYDRREPFPVPDLGHAQVIAGWNQGLIGVRQGARRLLIVPPDLGYGAQSQGPIKPNETLVFVIDAVSVTGK